MSITCPDTHSIPAPKVGEKYSRAPVALSHIESAPLKEGSEVARMYWSRKAESSAAIFLFVPCVLAFVKTIASPLLRPSPHSQPPSFSAHAQFRFFLCVRLTDKVPPALILKKSPSLFPLRPIYPWRRRTHSYYSMCRFH